MTTQCHGVGYQQTAISLNYVAGLPLNVYNVTPDFFHMLCKDAPTGAMLAGYAYRSTRLLNLFYAILASCNFLVMLYVPFIIIYFAKYVLFVML